MKVMLGRCTSAMVEQDDFVKDGMTQKRRSTSERHQMCLRPGGGCAAGVNEGSGDGSS